MSAASIAPRRPGQGDLRRGVVISGVIAAIGYFGFTLWAGWRDVLAALTAVGVVGMGAALGLSLINYGLRLARWRSYLAALGHPLPGGANAAIYFSGFAFTTTPGKAGELLRGVFLAEHGMPMLRSAAAFLSERLSDLLAVVLIALPGLAVLPFGLPVVIVGVMAVVGVAVTLGLGDRLVGLAHRPTEGSAGPLRKTARHVALLLFEARRCHTLRLSMSSTVLSLAAWSAEAFAFWFVLHRLGLDIGLWFAMSVYALAMLAGALSFLPGGLGGSEAVMAALLVWKGVPAPQAAAATIVIRLATLWFAVALGLIAVTAGKTLMKPVAIAEAA